MDDIRNIDESLPDVRNIRNNESRRPSSHLDEIIVAADSEETTTRCGIRDVSDTSFLLAVPQEQKPLHKFYGSTKHLFTKQKAVEVTEEMPFLLVVSEPRTVVEKAEINPPPPEDNELNIPKHDSQEGVERIISERRRLDDSFKEVGQHDIYEMRNGSKENLVEKDDDNAGKSDEKSSENG